MSTCTTVAARGAGHLRAAGWCFWLGSLGVVAGCATPEPVGPAMTETVWAVTADHQLIKFNAGQPQRVLDTKPLNGLPAGESVVGIDFRVARGVLYALTQSGRLYTVSTVSGSLTPVAASASVTIKGRVTGMDFNPTVDRIRVVNETGQNLRLHPETNAVVATDPDVAYAPGDARAGQVPQLAAAAYTYNTRNDKLTTNYAIDRAAGTLVTQGTREGVEPAVSPNTGRLFTVGDLGAGPLQDVSFDISDVKNTALAAWTTAAQPRTQLYQIDLSSGQARRIGTVAGGAVLRGLAIEP